jgi:hypothetical protein
MDESRYTNPELRKKLYNKIKKGSKGGDAGEWSARKAQLLAKEYKEKGGGYKKGYSNSQKSLQKWTKQDWQTSDTFENKKKGKSQEVKSDGKKRYLPKKAWEGLSESEKKKTNKAKSKGDKEGKQFVPQPKAIAKKTAKYRK